MPRFDLPLARSMVSTLGGVGRAGDDEAALLTFRRETLAALREGGVEVEDADSPTVPFDWEARSVLIVDVVEGDDDVFFYAAPAQDVPESVWEAMSDLDGVIWSGASDLRPEQWGSAVRYLASISYGAEDAESFHAAYVDEQGNVFDDAEIPRPSLEEIQSLWGKLNPFYVGRVTEPLPVAKLDRWFSAVFGLHRAQ